MDNRVGTSQGISENRRITIVIASHAVARARCDRLSRDRVLFDCLKLQWMRVFGATIARHGVNRVTLNREKAHLYNKTSCKSRPSVALRSASAEFDIVRRRRRRRRRWIGAASRHSQALPLKSFNWNPVASNYCH